MAEESGNSTAMSSAFMLLGAIHLQKRELFEALALCQRFQENEKLRQDFEFQSIAVNLVGMHVPWICFNLYKQNQFLASITSLSQPSIYVQVKGPCECLGKFLISE